MTEIRVKDRIFLALAIPLAAAAVYWYAWRADASAEIETLERKCASLVTAEDFDHEISKAEHEKKSAEKSLESERAVKPPAKKVKANETDSEADREVAVLKVFKDAGLRIAASERLENAGTAADVLRRTGCRPAPITRKYTIEGSYSRITEALSRFAQKEMAVVTEKIAMTKSGHWILEVTL